MLTRIEKLQAAHNIEEEDARMLLTINYVYATRQEDLVGIDLQEHMEAFTKRMCNMTTKEFCKLIDAIESIGSDRLVDN